VGEVKQDGVWRDGSEAAFTVETPNGSHAAWYFTLSGRDFGPYYTRDHAQKAMDGLAFRLSGKERSDG
jgi:hypothetical protein